MTQHYFSIATPTRNSLEKLKRCVGSVRGQQGISLEHLIQDANSSDGTPEWLHNQSNLLSISESDEGMYDAINKAWARSSGEIYSWLNSDEQYLPGTLLKVQTFFYQNPEVDVVFGNYIVADANGHPIALRREIPFRKAYVVNGFLNMQSATIFYRRKLWDRGILRLDSKYRYAADKDLILRLADAGVRFAHIPEFLSVFCIDGSNLSTHPQMKEESNHISLIHGAFQSNLIRKTIMFGRTIERLFSAGYASSNIRFKYAIDEVPTYSEISASRIGGRYTLADTRGTADKVTILKTEL